MNISTLGNRGRYFTMSLGFLGGSIVSKFLLRKNLFINGRGIYPILIQKHFNGAEPLVGFARARFFIRFL